MPEREKSAERLLKNKIVIITGAGNGIGRGVAIGMAEEGASVVLVDINEDDLEESRRLIVESNKNAFVIHSDVGDIDQNNRLVDKVIKEYGGIDILVNNAGINTEGGILDITQEGALKVFQTNLIGPFFLTQRVAKELVNNNRKGSILFTSSVHSQITQLHPAYTSSKAALEMFVKDTALELAEYGIRVNAVAPGAIAIREEKDRRSSDVPLGYRGTPKNIADAMVFLASERGSYITGQTLVVDGAFSGAHTWYWKNKGRFNS